MREEKVPAAKTGFQMTEEVAVTVRHDSLQRLHEFVSFLSTRPDRRRQPVGHQRLITTIFPPDVESTGVLQNLKQEGFVVALEKDALVAMAALDQQIDGLSRRRTAIDIIAEKHVERSRRRAARDMMIDRAEDIMEQVRASMDVADGIDSDAVGEFRLWSWLEAQPQHIAALVLIRLTDPVNPRH